MQPLMVLVMLVTIAEATVSQYMFCDGPHVLRYNLWPTVRARASIERHRYERTSSHAALVDWTGSVDRKLQHIISTVPAEFLSHSNCCHSTTQYAPPEGLRAHQFTRA
jgi:hypothetical protein